MPADLAASAASEVAGGGPCVSHLSRAALLDRERERAALMPAGDLRLGRGGALVVRGEAGVGKSALLEYVD